MEGLKLLVVFILIMVFLMRRAPLGPVMLGGSVLLAVLYHTHPGAFLGMIWRATQNLTTIELLAILTSIMLLEHLLGREGYLEKMLKGLKGLFRDRRVIMALIPAFIGLMPSAGGAIFSAPLVGQAAADRDIAAEEKSFVNYYYRHIWEYFLPLYPGVLLTSRLSGLPLPHLIAALAPYGLLVVLLGLPILRRLPPLKEEDEPGDRLARAKEFFTGTLPILVVLALSLIAQIEVGLAVGAVVVALLIRHRYNPSKLWNLCREAIAVKTLLLVWGIMVFKQVLVDTRAVETLPPLLEKLPVPGFLVFGFLSFLVGMLTGLMAAFVGITFPLITASMGDQMSLPLVVFVFIAGFTGTMLSPLHLCLVLTIDFFKADIRKVFRLLVGPEVALMTIALLGYLFRI